MINWLRATIAAITAISLNASLAAEPTVPSLPNPATTPESHDRAEVLTMATALAKAFRNNPTLVERRLLQEIFEINYDEAWRRMWLPSLRLNLGAGAGYTLEQLHGSAAADPNLQGINPANNFQHGTVLSTDGTPTDGPLAGAALAIGQYNIYNFGRDADALKAVDLEVTRSRETVHEAERAVRFQVIQAMFNFKTQQDLLEAAQRSVEAAESVVSHVKRRNASRIDASSTQIDLINARNVLVQIQTAYSQAQWQLDLVLGDPVGHPYKVKTEVKYIKFRMPLDEVLAVFRENAPAVRDARTVYEQRQAELRIAEKNALPLPTVSFSGINLGYNVTPVGTQPNRDPGNWNYQIGMFLSVPIVGDGGFLFGRALRAAEVRAEAAEIELRNAANVTDVNARTLYTQVLQTETTVELNQQLFRQSTDYLDSALRALTEGGSFSHLDLKSAIEQLRTAELNLTSSILTHYSYKLQLAQLIGVDRFPEENL